MHNNNKITIIKQIYYIYYICFFIILNGCGAGGAGDDEHITTDSKYLVSFIEFDGTSEAKLSYNSKNIMTLTNDKGIIKITPISGGDSINGLGTTWYPQPFLKGAIKGDSEIINSFADDNGYHFKALGTVYNKDSFSKGVWTLIMDFTYNPDIQKITGRGEYDIILGYSLDTINEDLFLYKITSNYLYNVPLLYPHGTGDTGNMERVFISSNSENEPYIWVPDELPEYFPVSTSDRLSIEVTGQYNNADTSSIHGVSKNPSYKPSLSISLEAINHEDIMSFGGTYDYTKNRNYIAENVFINPLISKDKKMQAFEFNIEFSSESIVNKDGTSKDRAGDSCKQILSQGHSIGDYFYWINLNRGSKNDAMRVFCDMTNDGGGWILYATINDAASIGIIKSSHYNNGFPNNGEFEISDIDIGNYIYKADIFNDYVSVMRLEMGEVKDFFRPELNCNFTQMLISSDKHLWSRDLNSNFIKPDYYSESPKHLGGSSILWPYNNFPGIDNRYYLSFWAGDKGGGSGGCCHYNYYSTDWKWGKNFKLWIR